MWRSLPYHHTPYCRDGSSEEVTSGETRTLTSPKVCERYTSSLMHFLRYVLLPVPATRGGSYALPLQGVADSVKRHAFRTHHPEDPSDEGHLFLINEVSIPLFVEAEPIIRARASNYLSFPGLATLAPVHPLGYLLALPPGDNIKDVIS